MPSPIIPWEISNFPEEIVEEFNRRKHNRGLVYINGNDGWGENGDWNKYKGPMTPWVRFCSNGVGIEYEKTRDLTTGKRVKITDTSKIKKGFVFFGGKDFYNGLGFSRDTFGSDDSIIGYLPDGIRTHVVSNDLKSGTTIHFPTPEIEKIDVIIQRGLFRRATVEWVCFSKSQLEYMTPYFLVPGLSCILEWGWNHFNHTSLINLDSISDLKKIRKNPGNLYSDNILKSKGNYDALFGIITNFKWAVEGNKFRCTTEITSPDRIIAGISKDASISESEDSVAKSTEEKQIEREKKKKTFENLSQFIIKSISEFKTVGSMKPADFEIADTNSGVNNIYNYIKSKHLIGKSEEEAKKKALEYIYGVFYGRDANPGVDPAEIDSTGGAITLPLYEDPKKPKPVQGKNSTAYSEKDFDAKSQSKDLWINLGLIIEILNYHLEPLRHSENEERFRFDIDDVVISGHPNLISTKGKVLLIPNSEAPKYFSGDYGGSLPLEKRGVEVPLGFVGGVNTNFGFNNNLPGMTQSDADRLALQQSDADVPGFGKKTDAMKSASGTPSHLADYQLKKVCLQNVNIAKRDNLDILINRIRYQNGILAGSHAFPFKSDPPIKNAPQNSKPYPGRYSGYLKDIYVNTQLLVDLMKDGNVDTYVDVMRNLMKEINTSAGEMWDFEIIAATGKGGEDDKQATGKIIDNKFTFTSNATTSPFTFDYFDADSLLQGIEFTPTLSDAVASRTIFAKNNNPDDDDSNVSMANGYNELLDFKFKDRLTEDDVRKSKRKILHRDGFEGVLRNLQQLDPPPDVYQMTTKSGDKEIIKRLVLPDPAILKVLLDDGDVDFNPKYNGILKGIQATFTIEGIGGLRVRMMFLVRNLPEPYSHENIVFQVINLQETISSGKWTTVITAGIVPLRGYIKARLGIPFKNNLT